ncbi:MAG TPA: Gfo/Idh/MocA family oxidoreductase [Capillimicrobium sp.]|nr:Gfo/Idh/MocA family oxidoreductase [Capillimicrobium sp.]
MSPAGYTPAPADERPAVGIGMLGYGFMGKAHTNALRTLPYITWPGGCRPELIGIAGRTESAVRDAATRYGFEQYATDWRALVADERVQVFDNVGPDDVHVEPTLAAIKAGKHVICEKPLALTAAEAESLLAAAEEAGVKHLTCFNYRFMPAVRLAYDLIREGEIGEIHQVRVRYSQEWRTDPEAELPAPAGALHIIGCHAIDQARFLIGEIEAVTGRLTSPVTTPQRQFRGQPVEQDDTVSILAEFAGGVVGTIDASLVSPGRKNHLGWEINGSKGSIEWNLEQLNHLRIYRRGSGTTQGFTEVIVNEADHVLAAPWWPSAHILGWEHGHANMLAHFLEAVVEDRPVAPYAATFADGVAAARVDEAVRRSSETGERVTVEPVAAVAAGGASA